MTAREYNKRLDDNLREDGYTWKVVPTITFAYKGKDSLDKALGDLLSAILKGISEDPDLVDKWGIVTWTAEVKNLVATAPKKKKKA